MRTQQPPLRLTQRGENVITALIIILGLLAIAVGVWIGLARWDKMSDPEPVHFTPPVAMSYEPHVRTRMATRSRPSPLPEIKPTPRSLPTVLIRIRGCESHDNYLAQNPASSASGAWQIIDGTWDHFHGYRRAVHAPPYVQDLKALALYEDRGTQPWKSSQSCWK